MSNQQSRATLNARHQRRGHDAHRSRSADAVRGAALGDSDRSATAAPVICIIIVVIVVVSNIVDVDNDVDRVVDDDGGAHRDQVADAGDAASDGVVDRSARVRRCAAIRTRSYSCCSIVSIVCWIVSYCRFKPKCLSTSHDITITCTLRRREFDRRRCVAC